MTGAGRAGLPEVAWLAALLSLPGMGPVRLRAQLDARGPEEAWEATYQPPVVQQRQVVASRQTWPMNCS